jgi:hypothetical protein
MDPTERKITREKLGPLEDRRCNYEYIYRRMCFTLMAPVRQISANVGGGKSTDTFGYKMRQFF